MFVKMGKVRCVQGFSVRRELIAAVRRKGARPTLLVYNLLAHETDSGDETWAV